MRFFPILIVLVILVAGCVQSQNIRELQAVEVRDYRGEQLSSLGDLRENSIKGPQYINASNYTLEVTGLVENPKTYTYQEILNMQKYTKVVTLYCVEGWSARILWEGVLLKDLLEESGLNSRGNTVIFLAADGYSSSLPLDYILENDIILAYRMNRVTLPPERGFPFQVVAEDKLGYKWVKWVERIVVSDDPEYRGFWESRGYSNTADVGGPYFE